MIINKICEFIGGYVATFTEALIVGAQTFAIQLKYNTEEFLDNFRETYPRKSNIEIKEIFCDRCGEYIGQQQYNKKNKTSLFKRDNSKYLCGKCNEA